MVNNARAALIGNPTASSLRRMREKIRAQPCGESDTVRAPTAAPGNWLDVQVKNVRSKLMSTIVPPKVPSRFTAAAAAGAGEAPGNGGIPAGAAGRGGIPAGAAAPGAPGNGGIPGGAGGIGGCAGGAEGGSGAPKALMNSR
mmetsp:Transcript_50662/g.110595  ORF Transcript_50662/g.110595 Transcript_50662/m.110595 type:complete len:142 (+) Transcript_50662:1138-1563(+)